MLGKLRNRIQRQIWNRCICWIFFLIFNEKIFRLNNRPGGNFVDQRKGPPRKRKNQVDPSDPQTVLLSVEKVRKFIETNLTDSYRILAKKLSKNKDLEISYGSVYNIAKNLEIKSYKHQKIPDDAVADRKKLQQ